MSRIVDCGDDVLRIVGYPNVGYPKSNFGSVSTLRIASVKNGWVIEINGRARILDFVEAISAEKDEAVK